MLCVGGYWGDKYLVDTGRFRGDKIMNRTLIQYRTTENKHSQFVVIPNIFVSDMIHWLSYVQCAEIEHTELSDNDFHIPMSWPSYRLCCDYIQKRKLLTETL